MVGAIGVATQRTSGLGRPARRFVCGLLLALAVPAAPALAAPAMLRPAPGAGLEAIPFPGTPDASPDTRVILPSLTVADVASVAVAGTASGFHDGRLIGLPDGAGVAFAPDHPFTPGERVHVHVGLRSLLAAQAAGVPDGGALNYFFRVAVPVRARKSVEGTRRRSGPASVEHNGMVLHSLPGLRPPTVHASGDPDSVSGDIFLTPMNSYQRVVDIQRGPMIVNSHGQLVWFRNIHGGLAMNLAVQTLNGRPVLTWWQGRVNWSQGEDVIADSSYSTLAVLHAADGYTTDSHEFQITPQGTAIINATTPVKRDLKKLGGPVDGTVLDDIVQELDIRTGRVLWEWHSLGHVPLSASYMKPVGSDLFDYFHLNSVQQLPDGNLLVSARHTWAVYEISRRTGRIIWTLGGKHSSFRFGPGAKFSWQHDARLTGDTLSLFDDASDGPEQEERQSSAKILRLNMLTRRATLAHRYTHSPSLVSISQGNTQRLPNGNLFVGWGADPEFSEYAPNGKQIFNASFVLGVNTYRAYRFPWTGRPATPPDLAITPAGGHHLKLYASWNGATGVAAWRVIGGDRPTSLSYVTRATRTGFETTIKLTSALPYLAVQALNSHDHVLATSAAERNPG
jgi:hypothetical protein